MHESSRPTTSVLVMAGGGVALVIVGGLALAALFAGGDTEPSRVPAVEDSAAVDPPPRLGRPEQVALTDERGQPASVEILLQRIRRLRREPEDESNRGRLLAIRALGELRSDRSRQALREIAEEGSDRFERLTAMSVIWAGDDRDYLIDLATRSSDPVVQAKVEALRAAEAGR